jgi:hypothetical protein
MTQQQRNWTIEAIKNCLPLVIFQHEQERLQTMMAKYVDPKTVISEQELKEDMTTGIGTKRYYKKLLMRILVFIIYKLT